MPMRSFCGIRYGFLIAWVVLLVSCENNTKVEFSSLENYISSLKINDLESIEKLILLSPVGCGQCIESYKTCIDKNGLLNKRVRLIATSGLQMQNLPNWMSPFVIKDISMQSMDYDFPLENICVIWLEIGRVKRVKNYIEVDFEGFMSDLRS